MTQEVGFLDTPFTFVQINFESVHFQVLTYMTDELKVVFKSIRKDANVIDVGINIQVVKDRFDDGLSNVQSRSSTPWKL